MRPKRAWGVLAGVAALGLFALSPMASSANDQTAADPGARAATTTPIKHLVVIFQENVSFDHYFGTYPNAVNPAGEPTFTARDDTPSINGLSQALRTINPNLGNPQRIDRSQPLTCDQGHDYTPEQKAADLGAMDAFVQNTGNGPTLGECVIPKQPATPGNYAVLDYYDGNTVTALWNYAQHFAMSDNSYGTTYGPSTPGALNVSAGNTFPVLCSVGTGTTGNPAVYDKTGNVQPCPGGISTSAPAGSSVGSGTGTMVNDIDPYYDACSSKSGGAALGGQNVGNLLSSQSLTWGWFQGGFSSPNYKPGVSSSYDPTQICTGAHYNIGVTPASLDGQPCVTHKPAQPNDAFCVGDYSAHHEPFQYFASTSNPKHMPPSSIAAIGKTDQANHQYDLADFWAAVDSGHMPAVSYLKAAKFQDGHAGYSDPLDEQHFIVDTVNHLQQRPEWRSTAVVVAYDDSDGWYDHVLAPITTQSQTSLDALTGPGVCGTNAARVPAGQQARCGLGTRQPLLVVSPFSRQNSVDHSLTDQSSVVRFIEDNCKLGRVGGGSADAWAGTLNNLFDFSDGPRAGTLFLNPVSGQPTDRD